MRVSKTENKSQKEFVLINESFSFSKYDLENVNYKQIPSKFIQELRKGVNNSASRINDIEIIKKLHDMIDWINNASKEDVNWDFKLFQNKKIDLIISEEQLKQDKKDIENIRSKEYNDKKSKHNLSILYKQMELDKKNTDKQFKEYFPNESECESECESDTDTDTTEEQNYSDDNNLIQSNENTKYYFSESNTEDNSSEFSMYTDDNNSICSNSNENKNDDESKTNLIENDIEFDDSDEEVNIGSTNKQVKKNINVCLNLAVGRFVVANSSN